MVMIPLSVEGESMSGLNQLAPGVIGYAMMTEHGIVVPWLEAEKEGSGDVGRFLDSLPAGARIPTIISNRLLGMVQRRGWFPETEIVAYGPFEGSECTWWVKPPASEQKPINDDFATRRGGSRPQGANTQNHPQEQHED